MLTSSIRVVIADDHPVIRDGIRFAFVGHPDCVLVDCVTSFDEVAAVLTEQPVHVVVLDLHGMGGSPLAAVARLRRDYPKTAIVVFSSTVDIAPELLAAGVSGYVVKEELTRQLVTAVRAAHRGERFLSPTVQQHIEQVDSFRKTQRLSPKESLVLTLLAQGLGTMDIAEAMQIDPRSVQNYITTMFRKTGHTERTQLVEWYARHLREQAS